CTWVLPGGGCTTFAGLFCGGYPCRGCAAPAAPGLALLQAGLDAWTLVFVVPPRAAHSSAQLQIKTKNIFTALRCGKGPVISVFILLLVSFLLLAFPDLSSLTTHFRARFVHDFTRRNRREAFHLPALIL